MQGQAGANCIDRLYIYTTLDIIADGSLGVRCGCTIYDPLFTTIEMNPCFFSFAHPLSVYLSPHDRHTH